MKIRALKAIVFAIWVGGVVNTAGAVAPRCQEGEQGRERANQAIKHLWSSEQSVRDSAKAALLDCFKDFVNLVGCDFHSRLIPQAILRSQVLKESQQRLYSISSQPQSGN